MVLSVMYHNAVVLIVSCWLQTMHMPFTTCIWCVFWFHKWTFNCIHQTRSRCFHPSICLCCLHAFLALFLKSSLRSLDLSLYVFSLLISYFGAMNFFVFTWQMLPYLKQLVSAPATTTLNMLSWNNSQLDRQYWQTYTGLSACTCLLRWLQECRMP